MFIDSHCHLNFPQLHTQLEDVLLRAKTAGVTHMQTICTKLSEYEEVYAIAEAHAPIFASVGIHPHETEQESATLAQLLALADRPKCIGIGETGLDYYYEHSNRTAQQAAFRTHIAASRETGLPLIVHTRDADDDTIAILQEEHAKGAFPLLIHCFSTDQKVADVAIALGGCVSISGIVTFKNAKALQESVRKLPLENLLIETDAPYLAPAPHRGKPCEPAFVAHTAQAIAELRGITVEEVAKQTSDNFWRFFTKAA